MSRFLLSCCVGILVASPGWPNSASPFPVEVSQPDGQQVTLFLRGTEKLNWYEFVPEAPRMTRDAFRLPENQELARIPGYTVVKDDESRYVFAELGDDGSWKPTDRVAGEDDPPESVPRRLLPRPEVRERMRTVRLPDSEVRHREHRGSAKAAAPVAQVHNLVVLMRFQDHADRTLPSQADFEKIFNASGGDSDLASTGSVRDFYAENSYGKMDLKSTVVDWVTLPETEAFYADGQSGLTPKIRQAITDALDIVAQDQLVDLSEFDNEGGGAGDGWIDAITFVHSGYGAEWGGVADSADMDDRIWSHRWYLDTPWPDPQSGVKVSNYNINPGLWSTSGSEPGRIGVVCHELGHFFGLPDLYDYSGRGEGIGSWGLMANSWGFDGSQLHPPHMSAWSKNQLFWIQPQTIDQVGEYKVVAAATPNANVFRINFSHGNSAEYLLIENRQAIGNFDGGIQEGTGGRGGLAIWHIDDDVLENDDPGEPDGSDPSRHYKVALIQADGQRDLEQGNNRGDAGDVFRSGYVDGVASDSTPSSNAYDGTKGPNINEISASGEIMTFRLGKDGTEEDETEIATPGSFRGFVRLTGANSHAQSFSDDGKAATLLFDRMHAFADGPDPLETTTASFILPLEGATETARARVIVRGYVLMANEGHAMLALHTGRQLDEIDLNEGRTDCLERSGQGRESLDALKSRIDSGLGEQENETLGFDFEGEVECEVPVGGNVHLTLLLLADRVGEPGENYALLWVDSVDVTIGEGVEDLSPKAFSP